MHLILENGVTFKGKSFGAQREVIGEVVFTTGMTGYLETLTDKSYYGQIIVQTFPLIGNYGVIPPDFEGDSVSASAYIVRQWCQEPSNFRSEGNLDTFFKSKNIVGLYDIDTRALTKIIREYGTMNGVITNNPDMLDIARVKSYKVLSAVASVTSKKMESFTCENPKYNIALLDYGLKENIKRELIKRGCNVYVFPGGSSAADIMAVKPDGIMLSNGPGDPADNPEIIETLKVLMVENIPMFGICLGHQLLALASGFKTAKLKYGHRGANQPVLDISTGRVYITSQNHGYAVLSDSIDKNTAAESFYNVNDKTCEGIDYIKKSVFSVQFHPEACGGPLDTTFLFDKFIKMIGGESKCL